MYLDAIVKIPDAKGKITYRTKGKSTYVEYEYNRDYDPERRFTLVNRKTIGKQSTVDPLMMQPNENFLRFFPNVPLPETRKRVERSCSLRIGTWIVLQKIIRDYKLSELLGQYIPGRDVGLFLDLTAYSIIEEDNRAQHYPAYAYHHPLFTEGMKIYSDSKISDFLKTMDEEASVSFQNEWNAKRNYREKIYISYDSTNKQCQAGDVRIVEKGHSKEGIETEIFNYAIAFDVKNQEPLFYELYPGSINDVSQLECMVDKAKGYQYKNIGFVLDRGYFSKENLDYMDENGYAFVVMMKGKKDLVRDWVLENKGTFEAKRAYNIPAYGVYGKTIVKKLFVTDTKTRYIHLYYDPFRDAEERADIEKKINQLTSFLKKHINQYKEFRPGMEEYFLLHYEEKAQKEDKKTQEQKEDQKKAQDNDAKQQTLKKFVFFEERAPVIELELSLCGYFVIVTSDKMTAKQALELYKGRDPSEKLFLSDKTFLGDHCVRTRSDESLISKTFVEFVALIIRNKMYNYLREEMKILDKKPNYMSVPAAIRELDKIEMARQLDGVYRLDHPVTAKQKAILKAFGLTEDFVEHKAAEITLALKAGN